MSTLFRIADCGRLPGTIEMQYRISRLLSYCVEDEIWNCIYYPVAGDVDHVHAACWGNAIHAQETNG